MTTIKFQVEIGGATNQNFISKLLGKDTFAVFDLVLGGDHPSEVTI